MNINTAYRKLLIKALKRAGLAKEAIDLGDYLIRTIGYHHSILRSQIDEHGPLNKTEVLAALSELQSVGFVISQPCTPIGSPMDGWRLARGFCIDAVVKTNPKLASNANFACLTSGDKPGREITLSEKDKLKEILEALPITIEAKAIGAIMVEKLGFSHAIMRYQIAKFLDMEHESVSKGLMELIDTQFALVQELKFTATLNSYVLNQQLLLGIDRNLQSHN